MVFRIHFKVPRLTFAYQSKPEQKLIWNLPEYEDTMVFYAATHRGFTDLSIVTKIY